MSAPATPPPLRLLSPIPPPPQSDPTPTEPLDMATSEQILDALRDVKTSIDDVKSDVGEIKASNAATAEWRRGADSERAEIKTEIKELREKQHKSELSIVKIMALATGASAAVSAVLYVVSLLARAH